VAFQRAQASDPQLAPFFEAAEGKTVDATVHAHRPCIGPNGLLMTRYANDPTQTVLVVPASERRRFLAAAHDDAHADAKRTAFLLERTAFWPGMKDDIAAFVRACPVCQSFRDGSTNASLGTPPTDVKRFEVIHMDFVPLPPSHDQLTGVFIIIDLATGWLHLCPVHKHDAASACKCVKAWCDLYGAPRLLVVDGGKELVGSAMQALAAEEKFTLRQNSPHNHQSNGVAENRVKFIKRLFVDRNRFDINNWPTTVTSVALTQQAVFVVARRRPSISSSAHAGACDRQPVGRLRRDVP
jgi:hypothetical protein